MPESSSTAALRPLELAAWSLPSRGPSLRDRAAGPLLVQCVLLLATARTFAPAAFDLLTVGRPPAGQQLLASPAAVLLTRLLTVALCAAVLAFHAGVVRLQLSALLAVTAATLAVEAASAARGGGAPVLAPVLALAVLSVAGNAELSRSACVDLVRRCLAPVVLASLLLAVVAPQAAKYGIVDAPFGSRSARLAGVTTQPNTLGAVAGVLVVALVADQRRRIALFAAGLVALYLTQSYTAWLATAVAVAVVLTARARRRPGPSWIGLPVLLVAVLAGLAGLATRAGVPAQVGTVSGRRALWDYVAARWSEQFWLGHGPGVWGRLVTTGELPAWAVHAHNQPLNTLFVSGALGGLLLAAFSGLLVLQGARAWSAGQALGAALVGFQVVRCFSEVPFELFFGGLNVVVLGLTWAALRASPPVAEP